MFVSVNHLNQFIMNTPKVETLTQEQLNIIFKAAKAAIDIVDGQDEYEISSMTGLTEEYCKELINVVYEFSKKF